MPVDPVAIFSKVNIQWGLSPGPPKLHVARFQQQLSILADCKRRERSQVARVRRNARWVSWA